MSVQNFAQLFRKSRFVRYSKNLPQVLCAASYPDLSSVVGPEFTGVNRPSYFGLKKDLPEQVYGKRVEFVKLKKFEGEFDRIEFEDAKERVNKRNVLRALVELTGCSEEAREASNANRVNYASLPGLARHAQQLKIPGRVVSAAEGGGFIISIGGVKALLPQLEIPAGISFNYSDILENKAFYFTLKSVLPVKVGAVKTNGAVDVFEGASEQQGKRMRKANYSELEAEQGYRVIVTLRK